MKGIKIDVSEPAENIIPTIMGGADSDLVQGETFYFSFDTVNDMIEKAIEECNKKANERANKILNRVLKQVYTDVTEQLQYVLGAKNIGDIEDEVNDEILKED